MASQRIRIGTALVNGGPSAVTITAAAGSAAGQLDIYVDNAEINSEAELENLLELCMLAVRDRWRLAVGGTSS